MDLFPVFNNLDISNKSDIDINSLLSNIYSSSLTYINLLLNPYINKIINKNILLIKIIDSNAIDKNNNLNLYFNEENYFNDNNNKTLTIFIYFDSTNKSTKKKYKKIINEKYDYIIINNIIEINKNKEIIKYSKEADLLFITPLILNSNFSCVNDSILLINELILINFYLKYFKENTSIIINNKIPYSLPRNQLYYYLFTNMKSETYYKNILSLLNNGYFIFENKKENIKDNINKKESLDTIINKYIKIDKSIEEDFCTEKMNEKKNILIKKIFKNKLSKNYINYINNINNENNKELDKKINKIIFLKKELFLKTGEINIKKVHNILLYNIDKSIDFLKKNNIEINDIYKTYKNPTSFKIIKDLFPYINDNLINKIQLARDSLYSISDYKGAEKTSFLIKKYFKNIDNILDCSSNIGGNTLNFSMNFKYVICNELNKETYNKLLNNVSLLNKKNVKCLNYDIIDLFNNKKLLQEIGYNSNKYVLFLDPEWTGPLYKMKINIDLHYGKTNIIDFVKNNDIKYACIKVPKNYNFDYLFDNFQNIKIEKYIYCYLIFITK